ncbi:MAG: TetR/AcrR family transcriptional regulator [Rhodothermales bacterium]|nr:TetR/AcrR family transcriptional regulator [Rhodothermales bacterium]
MEDTFSIRGVLETAADLYAEHGRFVSFANLAEATGVSEEALCDEFGTVDQLVTRYYVDLVDRCRETVESLAPPSAEERAGAFAFIMLDLLEERPDFVRATFRSYAAAFGSGFRSRLDQTVGFVLDAPDVSGLNQAVLTSAPFSFPTVDIFVRLLDTWRGDTSDGRQRSTALLDKVLRFYAGLATSPTLADGVDVVRYTAEAGYLPRIPFLTDWLLGSDEPESEPADNA